MDTLTPVSTCRHARIQLTTGHPTQFIDLTDRLRSYVTEEGLRVTQVKLPSGEHTVRLSLGDQAGGVTVKQMTLNVK